jgi:uncharacterized protein (TIGR03000 family)
VASYPVYYGHYAGHGCCGGYAVAAPAAVPAVTVPRTMPKVIEGEKKNNEGEVQARIPATVVVKADADVKLTVNGQSTELRSTEETFRTPNLTPGRSYDYLFVASATRDGKTVTKTERISVRPGQTTEIDFRNLGRAVAAAAEPATVTVVLPEGAKLYVNDVALKASRKQTFETPKLEKGKKFYYTVKVELRREGRLVSETKRVSVEAGKTVTVDFTTETSTLAASR